MVTALIASGVRRARAQEPPPDLRMLLNLDLFASRSHETQGAPDQGTDESMLDQIRTLDALGYLGPNRGEPGSYGMGNPAGAERPQTEPAYGPEGQP